MDPAENDDVNSVFGIKQRYAKKRWWGFCSGERYTPQMDTIYHVIAGGKLTKLRFDAIPRWILSLNLLSPFNSSPFVFWFKQGLAKMPKHPHLSLTSIQFVGGIVLMNISGQFRLSVRTWQLQNTAMVKSWCCIPLSILVYITIPDIFHRHHRHVCVKKNCPV